MVREHFYRIVSKKELGKFGPTEFNARGDLYARKGSYVTDWSSGNGGEHKFKRTATPKGNKVNESDYN